MLISMAVLLLSGLALGELSKKGKLPPLFGMIVAGIVIGPCGLNLLSGRVLAISADLRRIALIVILIRAGLKLNVSDLRRVGRPAALMCFLPASFETVCVALLGPRLLGLSLQEACILGAVLCAVSPAVVVPRMIGLIDEGRGTKQGMPQMILAAASVDDVYAIVLFTTFTGLAQGGSVSAARFAAIPVSIVTGAAVGALCGSGLLLLFRKVPLTLPAKAAVLLAVCFVLDWAEGAAAFFPFAGLIAVMAAGTALRRGDNCLAGELSQAFDALWIPAEIFLFVLVGASVEIGSVQGAGLSAVALIGGALLGRMAGVWGCLLGTRLTGKERLFCMLAYTPKATVQAAIGGLPLAMGLPCGQCVLMVSVLAILLTAPLGAFAIDCTCGKLLQP